jgi:hypothetical protein
MWGVLRREVLTFLLTPIYEHIPRLGGDEEDMMNLVRMISYCKHPDTSCMIELRRNGASAYQFQWKGMSH